MRIGVVVDSTCDLPQEFIEKHNIRILPITLHLDNDHLVDERDPQATLAFYDADLADRGHNAESAPFTVQQIQEVFLEAPGAGFRFRFLHHSACRPKSHFRQCYEGFVLYPEWLPPHT